MQEGADRGQSIQVGAVLLFGVLVILLATWQAVVVPQENEGVEFDHNQHVQGDVHELRNAIVSRGDGGTTVGVDIQLGTTYPTRVLFVNPDPPTGAIRTVGTGSDAVNVSVRNASAAGDAGDFWDGQPRNYTTGGMVYEPSYNRYDNAPRTTYENSLLYNDFGRRNLTLAGQALIDGNRITLVTLNGSLDRTRADATTVDVRPVTASRSRLGVVNATGSENLTIGIPTHLSATNWTTLLDEQLVANGGHVTGVSTGRAIPGTNLRIVNIHLERGVQYRLSLARVGVGTDVNTTVPARYLTRTAGNGSLVPENTTSTLEVRTWDRFNNPVGGVSVQANTSRADSEVEVTGASDDDGRIELRYAAPTDVDGGAETDLVNVSMSVQPSDAGSGFEPTTAENVTFDLTVDNADRSGTGGGGGGSGAAYNVSWQNPSGQPGTQNCDADRCTLNGSVSNDLVLTAATNPVADGADIFYAVNNSSTATVSPTNGLTDSAGKGTATLRAKDNGWVDLYTNSGGDGDVIAIRIINFTPAGGLVFVDAGTGDLSTVVPNGSVTAYSPNQPQGIGPLDENLVGTTSRDIPFSPNSAQNLKALEQDGSQTTLDGSQLNDAPIDVGDWDDDGTVEVVYVRADTLWVVEPGGTPEQLTYSVSPASYDCNPGQSPCTVDAQAVAGVGDIDGDGNNEIVYAEQDNNDLAYFDGSDETPIAADIDEAAAVSTVADIDNDGSEEVAIYDDTDSGLNIYHGTNEVGSVSSATLGHGVGQVPMGTGDWNGDGSLDVLYLDQNQRLRWYDWDDNVGGFIEDSNGNSIQADNNAGAR